MSIERRLREGLERSASVVQPDMGRRLPEAIARGRRRRRARRASSILATVAVLAGIGLAAPHVATFVQRTPHPAVSRGPTLTPGPDAAIAGTYTSKLRATSRVIRDNGMAGTWTLRLSANRVITVSAPRSFRGELTAIAFRIQGERFTTNAFVNDPRCSNDVGVYRWRRAGATLVFTPISDTCALRRALFSSQPWHARG
jgi:hypothetical protein